MKNNKLKVLRMAIDELKAKRDAEIDRNKTIFWEYCKMEGKYGKRTSDPWDCMQGMRGYHYEYAEGMQEKEKAEREEFLTANSWRQEWDVRMEYDPKIRELEDKFYFLKHGETREAARIKRNHKKTLREFEEAKRALERAEKELVELEG